MGFSLKSLGKIIDTAYDVTENIKKEVSRDVRNTTKKAGKFMGSAFDVTEEMFDEASKGFDRGLKKVGKFIDSNYKYIDSAGDFAAKAFDSTVKTIGTIKNFVVNVTKQLIDLVFIRNQVKEKCPDALQAEILAKKDNAVDVGIFSNNEITECLTINSDMGVSDDIYCGQIIEIY